MARKSQPSTKYPVHAQCAADLPVFGPVDWSAANLRASAQGAKDWQPGTPPSYHRVWCATCGELAGDCPELAPLLTGKGGVPASWTWRD